MTISFSQFTLFSVAALVLIFTPGPDIIYVMTRGMAQGRKAALAAAAGFGLGNLVHTFFVIGGLSAVLMSSARAFQAVKYAGAIYLVYIGIKMFRDETRLTARNDMPRLPFGTIFRQSIIANVLNPKVAVFFLAFLPQFVDTGRGYVKVQILIFGCTFVILALAGFSLVGICSGSIGNWLYNRPAIGNKMRKAAGCILALLGVRLVI